MNIDTKFIIQTDDCNQTKTGKFVQKFLIEKKGIINGMYTAFNDKPYKKGIYKIDDCTIEAIMVNGYTNLQIKDPVFIFASDYILPKS